MNTEEQFTEKRIRDLSDQSYRTNQYTFTGFLTPAQQDIYYRLSHQPEMMQGTLFGGTADCERQVLRLGSPEEFGYEEDFPICCIRVTPVLAKFADKLTHRDYLGALMHLGIVRDTIGDIVVKEDAVYFFCLEKMADFIVENLSKVKHTQIRCQKMEEVPECVRPDLKPVSLIVSSLRIDGVIAKLYHLSRSQSLNLFREKKIFVNGRQMENNSGVLKESDVVSVRGYGKFVCNGTIHTTKKGNLKIEISQYV